MIEAFGLSYAYEKKPVFSDLSFSLSSGKLYGIVGPNGCGKTTLIRLLCGIVRPGAGRLTANGRDYNDYSARELARTVSLLPQFRSLPPVTVEELTLRGRYPHLGARRMTDRDRKIAAKAMVDAGVADLAGRDVTTLSGGERQRACMALLLAQDTPCILLDEPTTYLDISHRFALMEQLKGLAAEGRCVAAVLHDLSLALRYCDEVLVLNDGRLQAVGAPEEILASGCLEAVFHVRCLPAENGRDVLFLPEK